MIQLICRWMCPESLHVYRRMGVAEHERLIKQAMGTNVDSIQSTNVPKVVGDQGYAELVDSLASPRAVAEQQAYDQALQAALYPYRREVGAGNPPAPPATPETPDRRARRGETAPQRAISPTEPEVSIGGPAGAELGLGDAVAAPRELWPQHRRTEMDGQAWHATVVAKTTRQVTVKFTRARTRDGRRYENARLPPSALRVLL